MNNEKIELRIYAISYSQTQSGAYALVLGEKEGTRRLPIIIGAFEAQAIAIELENMRPSRPLTHDLFKSFADIFKVKIKEVLIHNLVEGIFYAKIICEKDGKEVEIDSRTSDAIALAVRFKCPIYTYESILSSAGIIIEEGKKAEKLEDIKKTSSEENKDLSKLSITMLKKILQEAIDKEDYERASEIRDEIKRRKSSK